MVPVLSILLMTRENSAVITGQKLSNQARRRNDHRRNTTVGRTRHGRSCRSRRCRGTWCPNGRGGGWIHQIPSPPSNSQRPLKPYSFRGWWPSEHGPGSSGFLFPRAGSLGKKHPADRTPCASAAQYPHWIPAYALLWLAIL